MFEALTRRTKEIGAEQAAFNKAALHEESQRIVEIKEKYVPGLQYFTEFLQKNLETVQFVLSDKSTNSPITIVKWTTNDDRPLSLTFALARRKMPILPFEQYCDGSTFRLDHKHSIADNEVFPLSGNTGFFKNIKMPVSWYGLADRLQRTQCPPLTQETFDKIQWK